jgi:DNA-binding XRE family transcriptional regulator
VRLAWSPVGCCPRSWRWRRPDPRLAQASIERRVLSAALLVTLARFTVSTIVPEHPCVWKCHARRPLIAAQPPRARRFQPGRLSQEALAERAGLHWTYISGIERGKRNPGLNTLGLLAEALRVPLSDLLTNLKAL